MATKTKSKIASKKNNPKSKPKSKTKPNIKLNIKPKTKLKRTKLTRVSLPVRNKRKPAINKKHSPNRGLPLEEASPVDEKIKLLNETSEELEQDMRVGKKNADVYTEEGRTELVEDEEIDPWEEAFMEGADDDGQMGKDALTGEIITSKHKVAEIEYKGKIYRFVNEKNAQKFLNKKKDLE